MTTTTKRRLHNTIFILEQRLSSFTKEHRLLVKKASNGELGDSETSRFRDLEDAIQNIEVQLTKLYFIKKSV